jgi:hypothetical protein
LEGAWKAQVRPEKILPGKDPVWHLISSPTNDQLTRRTGRRDTNDSAEIGGPEAYAPARDSGEREHGHLARPRQRLQRPGASHPSSGPAG